MAFRSVLVFAVVLSAAQLLVAPRMTIAASAHAAMLAPGAQEQIAPAKEEDTTKALLSRVGEPAPVAVEEFKKAGMLAVKPHTLDAEERTAVEAALNALPPLHKRILAQHLHSLAFVDGIPGEGTGLTSPAAKPGSYDITLRASVIDEALSTFLTNKERRVYTHDASGLSVTVTGTGTNALTYVLLHESTHVLDAGCGITEDPSSPFTQGIWTASSTLAPPLAAITPTTYFRGGAPMPITDATKVYDALTQTPFVSLYATASRTEDFAELVAWHQIDTQHSGDLTFELRNSEGNTVRQWQPLHFAKVQARFADVDRLLASQPRCDALS